MITARKHSRVGFNVIKLRVGGEGYFLLRRDPDWNDLSFIGGHEVPRDNESLQRAAYRELLEEVPSLRTFKQFEIEPLISDVEYGPIYSKSARTDVQYTFGFFLTRFASNPTTVLEGLGVRTLNVLVREEEIVSSDKYRIAGPVHLLSQIFPGGLGAIQLSWHDDLGENLRGVGSVSLAQKELSLI